MKKTLAMRFCKAGSKKKLFWRLFVYFLLISTIPLSLVTFLTLRNAEDNIMHFARKSADSAMDIISYNITQQFRKYYHLAYFIARDMQLQRVSQLKNIEEIDNQQLPIKQYFQLLKGYAASVPDTDYVGVAFENGILMTTKSPDFQMNGVHDKSWYLQCKESPDNVHFIFFGEGNGPLENIPTPVDVIMACRAIQDNNGQVIGVSMVVMSTNILAHSATNILDRNGSFLFIMNENKDLIYSPYVGMIPQVSNEEMYVRVERSISSFGWNVIGMMRVNDAIESLRNISTIAQRLLIFLVIGLALISILISRRILRPINLLKSTMKLAEQGDLHADYNSSGNDEINDLGLSFNAMMGTIRNLISQVRNEQQKKRKAEISLLLANIKPHFLYNTLDSICWMASQYNADDIVDAIGALSTLYRIALSKGSDTIPIEDEISHVTSYLQLQKLRYEEKVTYLIEVDESCWGLKVQKLIIQPLVENAIYHGIKESDRNGFIQVTVRQSNQQLLIQISDNGSGITKDKLDHLRKRLKNETGNEASGYGMKNVHDRLTLSYGRKYGLTIESEYRKGTQCIIHHPILQK